MDEGDSAIFRRLWFIIETDGSERVRENNEKFAESYAGTGGNARTFPVR